MIKDFLAYFTTAFLGIVYGAFALAPYKSKITDSKPIQISGSVYVCQKAEVRVGK